MFSSRREIGPSNPRYSASPGFGVEPKAACSAPCGCAMPSATATFLIWLSRLRTYAAGRSGKIVKSSVVWKMIDSSAAVRGVPTSVAPRGISTGSSAGPVSRKRRSVSAARGGPSLMPSSSSSSTWSLSGIRFSR